MGLETTGEAYIYLDYHSIQIFPYDKINEEMKEVVDEFNELYEQRLIDSEMPIDDALKLDLK